MDLVDIDEVLDNLECEERKVEALRQENTPELKVSSPSCSLNGFGSNSIKTYNFKTDLRNGLKEYCQSVKALSGRIDNMTAQHLSPISDVEDNLDNHVFQSKRSEDSFVPCQEELSKYRNEIEDNKDVDNSRILEDGRSIFTHSTSNSSESLTTSSPSTFSSGPLTCGESSLEQPSPLDHGEETLDVNERQHYIKDEINLDKTVSNEPIEESKENNKHINVEQKESVEGELVEDLSSLSITHFPTKIHLETVPIPLSSIIPTEQIKPKHNNSKIQLQMECNKSSNSNSYYSEKPLTDTSLEAIDLDKVQDPKNPMKKQHNQHNSRTNVTFCSTMDNISDDALNSMLQEMDIDDEAENFMQQSFKELQIKIDGPEMQNNPNMIYENRQCENSRDYSNGDSFSQASTIEFSEVRATIKTQDMYDMTRRDSTLGDDVVQGREVEENIKNDNNDEVNYNDDDEEQEDQNINELNIVNEKNEFSRPQRPTTLNLPGIQSLDLCSNAGQTPPGNEQTDDELTSPPSPSISDLNHHIEQTLNQDAIEVAGQNIDFQSNLGKIPPIWVPDNMALKCMQCSIKFTMIKRRHHCRACGKVLCSVCCSQKHKLDFLPEPESRVCVQCYLVLIQREVNVTEDENTIYSKDSYNEDLSTGDANESTIRSPNPNNPMEYCSTIPPHKQVSSEIKTLPSVIVPVGVLKKNNNGSYSSTSSNSSGQNVRKRKSVMFSDGIAPGSDLATLTDQWNEPKQARRQNERLLRNAVNAKLPTPSRSENNTDTSGMSLVAQLFRGAIPAISVTSTFNSLQSTSTAKNGLLKANAATINNAPTSSNKCKNSGNQSSYDGYRTKRLPSTDYDETGCFIPFEEDGLPPIVFENGENGCDLIYKEVKNNLELVQRLQMETLKFAVQKNFYVMVKIVSLKCCLNYTVINFTTKGLHCVGNDEIVILLEFDLSLTNETTDTKHPIPKDIFVHLNDIYLDAKQGNPISEMSHTGPRTSTFLSSLNYGGFIYIQRTFQCMQDVIVPDNPYLIGVLIHRCEVPWAKVFPLRLMLRLGAQYRYYPCPHVSIRNRESVYAEIAQTIINFLADFRNYTYTLPFIPGMYIHMEDRKTTVTIPRNRIDEVNKAVNDSSDHILAFGGNFSKTADGHLVCMQNLQGDSSDMYSYSTQAINIQGQPRKITAASFFILNEGLKTCSGLSGKCSIIEDGLMLQILPTKMAEIRNALKNQTDVTIVCGPIDADEQYTEIVHLKWVDNDKEVNIGVKSPIDNTPMDGVASLRVYASFNYSNSNYTIRVTDIYILQGELPTAEITRLTDQIAHSTSMALVPFLDLLAANKDFKLALRATLNQDNVGYEAGTNGSKLPPLYMNALDDHLIPTLHNISDNMEETIILELVFYILMV